MLLTTRDSDVEKLLVKHQKKLKPMLAKKSRDSKIQAKIEPYARFIEAVEEEDYGKKFVYGKELSDVFGDEFIGRGLFGKNLFFVGEENNFPEDDEDELPEETEFAEILNENGALLTDKDFAPFEKAFTIEDCGREREITPKRFKRDFENPNIVKLVLFTTINNGGFAKCAIPVEDKFPKEHFDGVAQLLINKGYFQKYDFGKIGYFYSVTKSCYEFFQHEALKKFFKNVSKDTVIETEESVYLGNDIRQPLARFIYFRLYTIEREHGNFRRKKFLFEQSFRAEFFGHDEHDLCLGCFWYNFDECNKFLDSLRTYLDTDDSFKRVILAGLTLQHAENNFAALEAALANDFPTDTTNYLYSVSDDKFYLRGESEEISPEKIWEKSSDDDDAETEAFIKKHGLKRLPMEKFTGNL